MLELDAKWAELIAAAERRAVSEGRSGVVEFLRLKARNDAIRSEASSWLFASFAEAAADAQRHFPHISIERIEPHRFAIGNATMTGAKLEIRLGVRCLTVEAGWVRTPADGIMIGGAFAAARVGHFGLPRECEMLHLLYRDDLPKWYIVSEGEEPVSFSTQRVLAHVARLLDDH
jgi:hypothetical protein